MVRRLLNVATILSLALSAVAVVMWVRSLVVTEGWDFTPRLHDNSHSGKGWYTQRLVESGGGRIVYADYDALNAIGRYSPSRATGTWTFVETVTPLPPAGYQRPGMPLTPDLPGRTPYPLRYVPVQAVSGRIPGVAEWYIVELQFRRRFIAISWLAIAALGAILPAARSLSRWRRRRQRRAFPVVLSTPTPEPVPALALPAES